MGEMTSSAAASVSLPAANLFTEGGKFVLFAANRDKEESEEFEKTKKDN